MLKIKLFQRMNPLKIKMKKLFIIILKMIKFKMKLKMIFLKTIQKMIL